MPAAIEARGLTRIYRRSGRRPPVRAVDSLDLTVAPGEVLGLLGPNGAGKTTALRVLSCLLRPTAGTARVAGYDVQQQSGEVRAACGVSVESPGLYERLTAAESLTFFARLCGVAEEAVASRVEEQLRAADLWDRRDDLLGTFSRGMRQKMNIARALVHRPRVVFLDEPTSGLDVEAAREVREHVRHMSRDSETTFVLCTHNLRDAEALCHRIAVMRSGRIVATGTPDELRRCVFDGRVLRVRLRRVLPRHRETAASVAGVSRVAVEASGLAVHIAGSAEETAPEIIRRLVASGADVVTCTCEERSLEETYLKLLGRESVQQGADL